jgi:Aegerolysin
MAASRSMEIIVKNRSGLELIRTDDYHLDHGAWTDGDFPPESIPNRSTATWGSESDGFATGTEGHVMYSSSAGNFRFYWDNPFVGSNGFSVDTPPGHSYHNSDISGDNAVVRVTVS